MTAERGGQPVGEPVVGWTPPPRPDGRTLPGRTCRLVQLDPAQDSEPLFDAFRVAGDELWTYLPFGPPRDAAELGAIHRALIERRHAVSYAIRVEDRPVGVASYLRIDPAAGSIEVGAICYSPALARTTAATEAMFLMADHAFELGYRRYEWKCDSLNAASNAAACRLGFVPEGTFRKAMVVKGRNRDTNWLSITDDEWPTRRAELVAWLDPDNFDATGAQRRALR